MRRCPKRGARRYGKLLRSRLEYMAWAARDPSTDDLEVETHARLLILLEALVLKRAESDDNETKSWKAVRAAPQLAEAGRWDELIRELLSCCRAPRPAEPSWGLQAPCGTVAGRP